MGIPSALDAIVLAPAAILGLLGLSLGLGRSLVAWPMRFLIPLFAALLVVLSPALFLASYGENADLLGGSGKAAVGLVGTVAFLVTVALLAMFMRNLRERMAVWSRGRRIGIVERVLGGLLGAACGLLLVGLPYAVYAVPRSAAGPAAAWESNSVALPYFRAASEAARRALSAYLPPAPGMPPR